MVTVSYAKEITAAPGATGTVEIAKVPAGQKFTAKKILVVFPAGTYNELQITLMYGEFQVAPRSGYYAGDDVPILDDLEHVYGPNESIKVKYVNTNTLETRKCIVVVNGELE